MISGVQTCLRTSLYRSQATNRYTSASVEDCIIPAARAISMTGANSSSYQRPATTARERYSPASWISRKPQASTDSASTE